VVLVLVEAYLVFRYWPG